MDCFAEVPLGLPSVSPAEILARLLVHRHSLLRDERNTKRANLAKVCLSVQYLSLLESELEAQYGKNEIPFFLVMSSVSPLVRRIFELSADLNIKLIPAIKTRFQMGSDFDPLGRAVFYPNIKENLRWFERRTLDWLLEKDLHIILHLNFGIHHDLLHVIFTMLIEPQSGEKLRDYYLFIEALSFMFEWYIAREIGPQLSNLFASIGSTYRSYDAASFDYQVSERERFTAIFLTHLASLHNWGKGISKRRLGHQFLEAESQTMGFKTIFKDRTTHNWYKDYNVRTYPREYKNLHSRHEKLKIRNYELDHIANNDELLEKLWIWTNQLLLSIR